MPLLVKGMVQVECVSLNSIVGEKNLGHHSDSLLLSKYQGQVWYLFFKVHYENEFINFLKGNFQILAQVLPVVSILFKVDPTRS